MWWTASPPHSSIDWRAAAHVYRRSLHDALPISQGLARTVPGWSVTSTVPASGGEGENFVSHLELTADESALLVANRGPDTLRSEEHTSELQSRGQLVCRLLLERTKPTMTHWTDA